MAVAAVVGTLANDLLSAGRPAVAALPGVRAAESQGVRGPDHDVHGALAGAGWHQRECRPPDWMTTPTISLTAAIHNGRRLLSLAREKRDSLRQSLNANFRGRHRGNANLAIPGSVSLLPVGSG
jgi:hypothetical protein